MPLAADGQSPIPGSLSTPIINQRAHSSMDDASINLSDDSMRSEDVDGSESGTNSLSMKKPRISHACQACRRMKIRCEPLEYQDSCKQCSKTNRECLITTTKRKRQKTVHKIAELEEMLKTNSRSRVSSKPASCERVERVKLKPWTPRAKLS